MDGLTNQYKLFESRAHTSDQTSFRLQPDEADAQKQIRGLNPSSTHLHKIPTHIAHFFLLLVFSWIKMHYYL